ncbi:MAG: twin-arginine translocation signal domain-containing protein, partial [Phycisphaerae bacterium]
MKANNNKSIDRRNFLKAAGAAGLGSVIASRYAFGEPNTPAEPNAPAAEKAKYPQLPKRKLGRANIEVPVIANGVMFNVVENPIILRASLRHGITYWDTAYGYAGG